MWRTMLNIFRSVYTHIFIHKYDIFFHHKMPAYALYEYRNRTVGLIEGGPDRLILVQCIKMINYAHR